MIPWGWGVAWQEPSLRACRIMPIPLNWLAGWLRMAYYRVAHGPRDRLTEQIREPLEKRYLGAFGQGYKDGHREGWKHHGKIVGDYVDTWLTGRAQSRREDSGNWFPS